MALIEGICVHMAGADWVVPPLSFKALKKALPALAAFSQPDPVAQLEGLVRFLHAALQRNYPDLSEAELEERLELRDRPAIMAALPLILEQSGLVPQDKETADGTRPLAPPPTSTGTS